MTNTKMKRAALYLDRALSENIAPSDAKHISAIKNALLELNDNPTDAHKAINILMKLGLLLATKGNLEASQHIADATGILEEISCTTAKRTNSEEISCTTTKHTQKKWWQFWK